MRATCGACGQSVDLTPKQRAEVREADEYLAFVEEHSAVIEAVAGLIAHHVVENKPGSPAQVYDWPESEAVVILRHWNDLREIVTGGES